MSLSNYLIDEITDWLAGLPLPADIALYASRIDQDVAKLIYVSDEVIGERLAYRFQNQPEQFHQAVNSFAGLFTQLQVNEVMAVHSAIFTQICKAADQRAEYETLATVFDSLNKFEEDHFVKSLPIQLSDSKKVNDLLFYLRFIPDLERAEFFEKEDSDDRLQFYILAKYSMLAIGAAFLRGEILEPSSMRAVLETYIFDERQPAIEGIMMAKLTTEYQAPMFYDWANKLINIQRLRTGDAERIYLSTTLELRRNNDVASLLSLTKALQKALLQNPFTRPFFMNEGDVAVVSDIMIKDFEKFTYLISEKWRQLGFSSEVISSGIAALRLYQRAYQDETIAQNL